MEKFENNLGFAAELDAKDPLASYRDQFLFPSMGRDRSVYFCGNSLGLQPKATAEFIKQELEDWSELGVEGHLHARKPWLPYHEFLRESTARLVGALHHEVVVMNSLTTNLHLLMVSFYRPDKKRFKIIFENGPFSSDRYVFESQARFHGFDPAEALVELKLRDGEETHRNEDVIQAIRDCGDSLALVLIGGVNYYTGQLFDMATITHEAHAVGAIAGFDLAHAAGNVPLQLHDWDVDFAAWCSYKYLNAGPGAVGGVFVHDRHADNKNLPRFAGWWGNDPDTRFTMPTEFIPRKGADGWQLSNAPVFSMAALRASMELFDRAGMDALRDKSRNLTAYLEFLIGEINHSVEGINHIRILTPKEWRGCQLSLVVSRNGKAIHDQLLASGVIADWRHPDVIRVAPVPMYNSFTDVFEFGQYLLKAINDNK
ncbi:MAG: kynureninase [Bacteroidota bacterium]|jgi:kynureninase